MSHWYHNQTNCSIFLLFSFSLTLNCKLVGRQWQWAWK